VGTAVRGTGMPDGFDLHLVKPVQLEDVVRAIED
jgi:hypothetical protein